MTDQSTRNPYIGRTSWIPRPVMADHPDWSLTALHLAQRDWDAAEQERRQIAARVMERIEREGPTYNDAA